MAFNSSDKTLLPMSKSDDLEMITCKHLKSFVVLHHFWNWPFSKTKTIVTNITQCEEVPTPSFRIVFTE